MKYCYDSVHSGGTVGDMVLSTFVPGPGPQHRLRETLEKFEVWSEANHEFQAAYRDAVAHLPSSVRADTYS